MSTRIYLTPRSRLRIVWVNAPARAARHAWVRIHRRRAVISLRTRCFGQSGKATMRTGHRLSRRRATGERTSARRHWWMRPSIGGPVFESGLDSGGTTASTRPCTTRTSALRRRARRRAKYTRLLWEISTSATRTAAITARIIDTAAFSGTSIITRSIWRSAAITRSARTWNCGRSWGSRRRSSTNRSTPVGAIRSTPRPTTSLILIISRRQPSIWICISGESGLRWARR